MIPFMCYRSSMDGWITLPDAESRWMPITDDGTHGRWTMTMDPRRCTSTLELDDGLS